MAGTRRAGTSELAKASVDLNELRNLLYRKCLEATSLESDEVLVVLKRIDSGETEFSVAG